MVLRTTGAVANGKLDGGDVDQVEKEAILALIEKWIENFPLIVASPITLENDC